MADEGIKVKGAFRLNIVDPDGTIVGDSGWHENQITDLGFRYFLIANLAALAGSSAVGYVSLGTGTVPGAAATSLNGELQGRQAVSASSSGSKAVNFYATFASANSFCTTTQNISNIGLFAAAATNTGTLFAGNTYASSSCASNQAVNVTYTITLS